ncbi:hypothetical protein GEMRC1_007901 [Eukaryota sp. GEM-RC1]
MLPEERRRCMCFILHHDVSFLSSSSLPFLYILDVLDQRLNNTLTDAEFNDLRSQVSSCLEIETPSSPQSNVWELMNIVSSKSDSDLNAMLTDLQLIYDDLFFKPVTLLSEWISTVDSLFSFWILHKSLTLLFMGRFLGHLHFHFLHFPSFRFG